MEIVWLLAIFKITYSNFYEHEGLGNGETLFSYLLMTRSFICFIKVLNFGQERLVLLFILKKKENV
jgi:hypothetical protein